jgi:hypothetical protein
METNQKMLNLSLKNFSFFTVLSLLMLIAGIVHFIYWGLRYDVWADIGIYSITVVLIIPGIIGLIISLMEKTEEND